MKNSTPLKDLLDSKIDKTEFKQLENRNMRVPIHQPSIPGKFMTLFVENQTKMGFGISSSRKMLICDYKESTDLLDSKKEELDLKESIFQKFKLDKEKRMTQISQSKMPVARYIVIPKICLENTDTTDKRKRLIFRPPTESLKKNSSQKDGLTSLYQSELTKKLHAIEENGPGCYNSNDECTKTKIQTAGFIFLAKGRDWDDQKTTLKKSLSTGVFQREIKKMDSEILKIKTNLKNSTIQSRQNHDFKHKDSFIQNVGEKKGFLHGQLPKIQRIKDLEIHEIIKNLKKFPIKSGFFDQSCQRFKIQMARSRNRVKRHLVLGELNGKNSLFLKQKKNSLPKMSMLSFKIRENQENNVKNKNEKSSKRTETNNTYNKNEAIRKESNEPSENDYCLENVSGVFLKMYQESESPTKELRTIL